MSYLFATPWTAALQASGPLTVSQSLFKLMSMELEMPSKHLILCHPLLFRPSIFPCIRFFVCLFLFLFFLTKSQPFTSGGWSIGASASASVLPMNIHSWFPLGWTGLISLLLKGLSRVFSNTIVQKHQFSVKLSLWATVTVHTWLLEKPEHWLDGPLSAKSCLCFLICCLG